MTYKRETPDVAVLGEIEDGLPEVVEFTYDSGRTVSADYVGIEENRMSREYVVYEVSSGDQPLTIPRDVVQDRYDVVERLGEREGYRDTPTMIDEIEPLETGGEGYEDGRTVDEILEDDRLDPL